MGIEPQGGGVTALEEGARLADSRRLVSATLGFHAEISGRYDPNNERPKMIKAASTRSAISRGGCSDRVRWAGCGGPFSTAQKQKNVADLLKFNDVS